MLGGYSAIGNGGYTARGCQLLTGCPDTTTVTLDANSEAKQIEAFTTLCQYDDANYLMGTHTPVVVAQTKTSALTAWSIGTLTQF